MLRNTVRILFSMGIHIKLIYAGFYFCFSIFFFILCVCVWGGGVSDLKASKINVEL